MLYHTKNLGVCNGIGRHCGMLTRGSSRPRGVEMVRVFTGIRKKKVAARRGGAGELMLAVWPPAAKRACADCRSTSTPLWRKGPTGPKTLCNACGIRYMRGLAGIDPSIRKERIPSSLSATTREGLSYEELKQRQKEKQMKTLLLLGWPNYTTNKGETMKINKKIMGLQIAKKSKVSAVGGKNEAEEAALLLLSLSSPIFAH